MKKCICCFLKGIYIIVNILFFIYMTSFFINNFNINKANIFGYKPIFIITNSMQPEINIGNIIMLKKFTNKNYAVGDVVAYEKRKALIIHRIVKIEDNYIYLKGDNNLFADEPIKSEDIIYKVI